MDLVRQPDRPISVAHSDGGLAVEGKESGLALVPASLGRTNSHSAAPSPQLPVPSDPGEAGLGCQPLPPRARAPPETDHPLPGLL